MYDRDWLVEMREMAKRLGFRDDADHWQEEIARFDAAHKETS